MAEIIDDDKAQELERKLKSRTRVRGLLIGLNIILVAYLCYSVTDAIIAITKEAKSSKDFVAICGKSEKGSKKIYDKYVKEVTLGDYMLFNDRLTVTKSHFQSDNADIFNNVQLVNVCPTVLAVKSEDKYHAMGNFINDGINLFTNNGTHPDVLEEGDYLFFTDYVDAEHMGQALNVDAKRNLKHVFYSYPLEDGRRVQTTIYAYEKNPALVMNVKYVAALPENYYDVILKGDATMSAIAKSKLEQRNLKIGSALLDEEKYFFASARVIIDFMAGETEKISVNSHVESTFEKEDTEFNKNMLGYALADGSLNAFYSDHHAGKLVVQANYIETPSDTYWNFLNNI